MKFKLGSLLKAREAHSPAIKFSSWTFFPNQNSLQHGDFDNKLENKQTRVLLYLLAHAGQTVSKDDILNYVWDGRFVGDDVLAVAISHLRKILGDAARSPKYIMTIPGKGYRFIGFTTPAAQKVAFRLLLPHSSSDDESQITVPLPSHKRRIFIGSFVGILLIFLLVGLVQETKTTEEVKEQSFDQISLLLKSDSEEDWRKALALFEGVNKQNPTDARAYWGMARAQMQILRTRPLLLFQARHELLALLNKANELAPDSAAVQTELARVQFWVFWDMNKPEEHYQNALKRNPASARLYIEYAQYRLALGDFEGATTALQRGKDIDPTHYSSVDSTWLFNMQRKYDLAILELERLLAVRPNSRLYHLSAQALYENMGLDDRSFEHLKKVLGLKGYEQKQLENVDMQFQKDGLKGVYSWLAFTQKETADIGQYTPPLSYARYAIKAGKTEEALDFLEQAVSERQIQLLWMNVDPKYDALRESPRFQAILESIGLIPAAS